ncbi:amidohydrolase family protein [Actinopolymorpha sp. B9G3]|uniref:amidohydrolase family protein n=1 Tax=unclassified Actinopolymorpha TaxID=2627063 RepID=UPI0032D910DE
MTIIDSNVHNEVPHVHALLPYLSDYWVEQIDNTVFRGPAGYDAPYPPNSDIAVRPGCRVADGPPDLEMTQRQVLGPSVEAAILLCTYAVNGLHNPDQAVALAKATNDWQIAEWLDRDSRLRASIVVPSQLPHLAAAEIERVADHPGFVQVALPARAHHPYGNRLFHPLWEAIVRHDLVAGIYFGGAPGNPTTPVGWPSYFIEEYVGMAHVFAAQLTSLVSEGVFDLFPTARVTLVESGVTWLPAHLWKFDKEWKNLRLQVPWVKRPPSSYIRDHVRLTAEPWDMPADDRLALDLLDQLGSEDLLLFATGFPHQSPGNLDHLLGVVPEATADRIRATNAQSWYRGLNHAESS